MVQPFLRTAFWIALVAVLVLALWPQPVRLPASDKTQHVAAFFTFGVLAAAAYPDKRLVLRVLGLLSFGALIELLQLIPALNRSGEMADLVADGAGILLSLPFIALAGRLRARRFASGTKAC